MSIYLDIWAKKLIFRIFCFWECRIAFTFLNGKVRFTSHQMKRSPTPMHTKMINKKSKTADCDVESFTFMSHLPMVNMEEVKPIEMIEILESLYENFSRHMMAQIESLKSLESAHSVSHMKDDLGLEICFFNSTLVNDITLKEFELVSSISKSMSSSIIDHLRANTNSRNHK